MAELLMWVKGSAGSAMAFRRLSGPLERLRGLLFTKRDAAPVALMRCASVHTFGMAYPIDIAFVGQGGVVLETRTAVGPGKVLSNGRAAMVCERPHTEAPWLYPGQRVEVKTIEGSGRCSRSCNESKET
jgi:hypothetical protein